MATLTTGLSSYKTFHTIADINTLTDNALGVTDYYPGVRPTGAVDLQILDAVGKHLKVNNISIIVHTTEGTNDDTLTELIYGQAEQGPPQLIASIVWKIGQAQVSATVTELWAQDATITSSHMRTITKADGGDNDRICSVTFDLTGYRYIIGRWTAETGSSPHLVTALYRSF